MNDINSSDLNYNLILDDKEEDIDLKKIFKFFWRNKKRIITYTLGISISSCLITFSQKPIFKGSVIILAEDKSNKQSKGSSLSFFNSRFSSNSFLVESKTNLEVLKSPYILKPIYRFLKESNTRKNIKTKDFDKWINSDLDISFKKDTKILQVILKNQDKEIILSTLSKISERFKDFSKEDKIKNINNGIQFLNEQSSVLSQRSNKSLTKLNKFSIENGLGDIDGFIKLEEKTPQTNLSSSNVNDLIPGEIIRKKNITKNPEAGQRFKSQLEMLEQYETELTRLSYQLKPSSRIIKNLKTKIETFKESLKRPNQILLEYRNLKRIAERDLNLLNENEQNLSLLKYEKARKQEPWFIISKPFISKYRVFPQRTRIALFSIVLSFIFTSLIALLQERKKGIVHEFDFFKLNFKYKFIDTLYENELILNNLTIENTLKENIDQETFNKQKIGFLFASDQFQDKSLKSENFNLEFTEKQIILNIKDFANFENCDFILIFFETGKITTNQMIILEKYLSPYKEKILGWFFIDKERKLS